MERFVVYIDEATLGRFNTAIEAYEFANCLSKRYAGIKVVDNLWGMTWLL